MPENDKNKYTEFSIVALLSLVMGGTGNVATEKIWPSRVDPYTGTQGKTEALLRSTEDARLWEAVERMRTNCMQVREDCRDMEEAINHIKHAIKEETAYDTK